TAWRSLLESAGFSPDPGNSFQYLDAKPARSGLCRPRSPSLWGAKPGPGLRLTDPQCPTYRSGSNGASSDGTCPVTMASASSWPVRGPRKMPHMQCPPPTYTRGDDVRPISGSPSAVQGREPTPSPRRPVQAA